MIKFIVQASVSLIISYLVWSAAKSLDNPFFLTFMGGGFAAMTIWVIGYLFEAREYDKYE